MPNDNIELFQFNMARFKRVKISTYFEPRGCTVADFGDLPSSGSGSYYAKYQASPAVFAATYPNFQAYMAFFTMRTPTIRVTGRQACQSSSYRAADVDNFLEVDTVTPPNMLFKGGSGGDIPSGKYLIESSEATDLHNGLTMVEVTYIQTKQAERIQIQAGEPPDPTGTT